MEENPSLAFAASISFFITAISNAIIVLIKETNAGFKNWLVTTFGHHWIGHGILLFIIFIVVTLIIQFVVKIDEIDERLNMIMTILILGGTLLSVIIIGGYFWMNLSKELAEVSEFILNF